MAVLTKKEFCLAFIRKWALENGYDTEYLMGPRASDFVYQSTCLGIALETLGLITEEREKNYLSSRGGNLYVYAGPDPNINNADDFKIMSMRDMLSLLPD